MFTESAVASNSTDDAVEVSKQLITPTERWVLICEDVYSRAQKRGFVGGNPLQDLADAEQEVDATYETDFNCVFSLTSTAEITEQLKSLFAGYGFDHDELEHLLGGHQEGLNRLASMNGNLLDGPSALAVRQTQVLQDVASESAKTLQSFAQGLLRPEGVFKIAELSMQAFDSALTGLQSGTWSAPTTCEVRPKETPDAALIQGEVARECEGRSAKQLVDAPTTVLSGISDSLAKKLEDEFAISSVREMATNKHAEWARAVVLLADEEPAALTVSNSRITEARNVSESQASLLKEEFGIETVHDLGTNHLFNAARAVVMLAESAD